jgi:hypothetical protein
MYLTSVEIRYMTNLCFCDVMAVVGVELRAPTPAAVGTPKPTNNVDDEEPPLNEDDDDDDDLDDLDQGEEEPTTQHLVLAQFDKASSIL